MQFDDLQRQIIMDHFKHPQNNEIENKEYLIKRGVNPSCGDDISIYLIIEDNKIVDIKWQGSGCSICCASASILSNEINGLSIDEFSEKYYQFKEMLIGNKYDPDSFEDAICFAGIKDFPARFKCAIISWDTVSSLLKGE